MPAQSPVLLLSLPSSLPRSLFSTHLIFCLRFFLISAWWTYRKVRFAVVRVCAQQSVIGFIPPFLPSPVPPLPSPLPLLHWPRSIFMGSHSLPSFSLSLSFPLFCSSFHTLEKTFNPWFSGHLQSRPLSCRRHATLLRAEQSSAVHTYHTSSSHLLEYWPLRPGDQLCNKSLSECVPVATVVKQHLERACG